MELQANETALHRAAEWGLVTVLDALLAHPELDVNDVRGETGRGRRCVGRELHCRAPVSLLASVALVCSDSVV